MHFKLPELPFHKDDFHGIISAQTIQFHHGKHHKTYVNTLNDLIKGTQWENKSLDDIVLKCEDQKIFNNAGQHWNHSFYWYCMTPMKNQPTGQLKDAIQKRWGSTDKFMKEFTNEAVGNFGSGWTWLAKQGDNLTILNTSNAGNPLTSNYQPLLTIDVWEHAYYIDYRNQRKKYVQHFNQIINWKFVECNYNAPVVRIKL